MKMKQIGAGLVLVGTGVSAAHAELPAAVTSAFSSISADASSLLDLAWPVVLLITGGLITIKLFKKFVNRAS